MIKLNVPLWELLMYGAALSLIVLFRISGESLKNRLSRAARRLCGERSDTLAAASGE